MTNISVEWKYIPITILAHNPKALQTRLCGGLRNSCVKLVWNLQTRGHANRVIQALWTPPVCSKARNIMAIHCDITDLKVPMLPQLMASLPLEQSLKNFTLDKISTYIHSRILEALRMSWCQRMEGGGVGGFLTPTSFWWPTLTWNETQPVVWEHACGTF